LATPETHTAFLQVLNRLDEMGEGTTEAVEPPNNGHGTAVIN
jgi:hypothetical protein